MAAPRAVLTVECLEDRITPATFGLAWPDPQHLTLSFVPDGTRFNGHKSQLFQALGTQPAAAAAWQQAILQAFQTWASVTNINVGVVPDGGQDLGASGALQGDSRFGDLRIAGSGLSPDLLALGTPFDFTAGTWSGDVVFNTNFAYTASPNVPYNLLTVALHEAGHAFGLADNNDPNSVLYGHYDGTRTQLAPQDVQAIQNLYGVRVPDPFELRTHDTSAKSAAPLNLASADDNNGYQAISLKADITTANEAEYYRLRVPNGAGGLAVNVKTSGLSLLDPKVTIYDQAGSVLGTAAASKPGTDLSVHVANLPDHSTLLIKVEGATTSVFGIGGYQLEVRPDSAGNTPANQVQGASAGLEDDSPDSLFPNAHHLAQQPTGSANRFDYTYQQTLSSSTDVDYYRVRALPGTVSGSTTVLTAVVWARLPDGLLPKLRVFDNHGNLVSSTIVVNENGNYVVQVANANANQYYYVAVSAADSSNSRQKGDYFLGVDFNMKAVNFQTIAQTTVSAAAPVTGGQLQIVGTQTVHLALSIGTPTPNPAVVVQMTIFDSNHNVIFTQSVRNGETVTSTLLLTAGTYTVVFAGKTLDGSALPTTNISLSGTRDLSDDLGPQLITPNNPNGSTPPPPPNNSPPPSGNPPPTPPPGADPTAYYLWYNGMDPSYMNNPTGNGPSTPPHG